MEDSKILALLCCFIFISTLSLILWARLRSLKAELEIKEDAINGFASSEIHLRSELADLRYQVQLRDRRLDKVKEHVEELKGLLE